MTRDWDKEQIRPIRIIRCEVTLPQILKNVSFAGVFTDGKCRLPRHHSGLGLPFLARTLSRHDPRLHLQQPKRQKKEQDKAKSLLEINRFHRPKKDADGGTLGRRRCTVRGDGVAEGDDRREGECRGLRDSLEGPGHMFLPRVFAGLVVFLDHFRVVSQCVLFGLFFGLCSTCIPNVVLLAFIGAFYR
ncbi:4-mannosyl-glycoprotein 4-beta-N-acetylglucosaminyltransferase [Striga asiatica]|uniref:4-mannosyl-glycoprotein 4-beta-N-acetylglucosaminyltransferase n=1 Tax=Striga asiatica TaxID=4170 RepID=A0A5A7PPE8_STRAF|nr:4-mannosyl-glycoprotein 4-beta-N-acetylglucosaminyltransferase [Striga asiatica]